MNHPPKAELNFWDPTASSYMWSTQTLHPDPTPLPSPAAIVSQLTGSVVTTQSSADSIRVCLSCKERPHPRSCTSQGCPHPHLATERSTIYRRSPTWDNSYGQSRRLSHCVGQHFGRPALV